MGSGGKRPSEYVGKRVELARKDRQWRQSDLAERLAELGFTGWRQSKIAKIENGETKRISLEDVLALALALGVKVPYLLSPAGDEGKVEVAPKLACSAPDFRGWLSGYRPLIAEDERTFYLGALAPDDEATRILRVVDEVGGLELPGGLVGTPSIRKEADDAR